MVRPINAVSATNVVGWLLVAAFLVYGLIRVGVGGLLFAQTLGLLNHSEFSTVVTEVDTFIDARADRNLVGFNPTGYFAWIASMGLVLTAGAIGAVLRRRWGQGLVAVYLAMHAALFVNFQEINSKLLSLGVTVVMLIVLVWARPAKTEDAP